MLCGSASVGIRAIDGLARGFSAGAPAPPVLHTAVPNWQAGETIALGADRMLRVVETRFVNDDPVLVVEPA